MPVTTQQEETIQRFTRASLRSIVRAELDGRVPERFSGTGQEIWKTFRNELTAADLVALAIQDAGVSMPIPFNPSLWWPDWPDWALLDQPADQAETWIKEAINLADQPEGEYLISQAKELGIPLPSDEVVEEIPEPLPHEKWLELPGTGGWLAYSLCTRPNSELYLWENFEIVCDAPEEVLFAGLIAWELNAPPKMELPIHLDDSELTNTLRGDITYHRVLARRDVHGHRALGFLQKEGSDPTWL